MTKKHAHIIVALTHANMNVNEVARRLYFGRNTVTYHIQKIKEDTGLDPLDFFDLGKLYSIARALLIAEGEFDERDFNMRKTTFKEIVASGRKLNKSYMAVKIVTDGNPFPEIIVNPVENLDAKLAYYDEAYDDSLELISAKKAGKTIRISDVLMRSNLGDLNWFIW